MHRRAGNPQALFQTSLRGNSNPSYDVAPDGQRFLIGVLADVETQRSARLQLIVNWQAQPSN